MSVYFNSKSIHLRDSDYEFNCDKLKIGWKDKDKYYFISESSKGEITQIFELVTQWYLDFIFFIQNLSNTGCTVKYSISDINSYYYHSSYMNKTLNIKIIYDDDILFDRILDNKVYKEELNFIFTILSDNIQRNNNPNIITSEWKKNWIDENNTELSSQPNNFKIKLFEYQLRSLKWALDIEKSKYMSSFYSNCRMSMITANDKMKNLEFDMVDRKFIFGKYSGHKQSTNGGILADEMGLGKTITSIALITKNQKIIKPNLKLKDISINLTDDNKLSTKTTLIICPSHLTKQWYMEVKKCTSLLNSALVLTKTNHQKYTYREILEHDIVIVSFQFLWNTNWYVNYPYYETSDYNSKRITNSQMVSTFSRRWEDICKVFNNSEDKDKEGFSIDKELDKVFTFENIHWHRVIVDEAHEIFKSSQYSYNDRFLLLFINNLKSDNRWFVSGTPFWCTEGFNNIMDFLNYRVKKEIKINEKSYSVSLTYRDLLNHHISYNNIKDSIFCKFYIRNTKESVKDTLNIPPAIIDTLYLKFSEFEEKLYMSLQGSYSEEYLRKICCNIQVCEKFSNHELSEILNFDQVKDKMIKDAKDKLNKTKITINSLDNDTAGYAARLQMLNNIISSCEFIIKSFENTENEKVKEEICPICRCDMDDPVITQCGHNFCYDCITSVLEIANYKKECPICRTPIDNSKIYKLDNEDKEEPSNEIIDELTFKYGTKLAKLIRLCKTILNDNKNKIIIFSQWDRLLSMIGSILKINDIDNVFCKGNVHQRNAAIMSFRKDAKKKKNATRVIMLSTENAASGTNLTEATHIIFMEPIKGSISQVKSIEDQAIGRAVRLGQENQVNVYKLIIKDTVEEDIFNNLNNNSSDNIQNNNQLQVNI